MEIPKPVLTLQHWHKTQEGAAVIAMEKPFVLQGVVYQGYRGAIPEVPESNLTDAELKEALDIDGTKDKVFLRRHQRIGSRHDRKSREYAERRATLRSSRNEIRESMLKDKAAGLPENPADLHDMAQIDKRMARLVTLTDMETDRADGVKAEEDPVEAAIARGKADREDGDEATRDDSDPAKVELSDGSLEIESVAPPVQRCDVCEKPCPPDRDFAVWLRGHKMGAHSKRKKK